MSMEYQVWVIDRQTPYGQYRSLEEARAAVMAMEPSRLGSGATARFFRVPGRLEQYVESFSLAASAARQTEDGTIIAVKV